MLSRRLLSVSPLLVSRSTAVRTTPKFCGFASFGMSARSLPTTTGPKAEEGGEKAEASGQKPNEFPKPPLTPEQMKRLRKMIVISFVGSTVLTLFIMSRVGPGSKLQGESVPFDVFVEKFLKAGEVKNIMYLANDAKAVVTLHDGAVIEGRPYEKNTIIVNYGQVGAPPEQFQNEIRRVEEKLGIGGPRTGPRPDHQRAERLPDPGVYDWHA
ncbi:hypothetical protein M3Y99_00192600 [Aphelenchoides fujianensis]|nr:hypothetical protein M3Y99_00192600 [Aphelenchoides fujianensis]